MKRNMSYRKSTTTLCYNSWRSVTSPNSINLVIHCLQAERNDHALTKAKLVSQSEKLHFSQGEVETLKQQLDREKATFEKA